MAAKVKQKKERQLGRHDKLPTKRSINLVNVGKNPINWAMAIPLILAIVMVACVISKFAVVDRYAALYRAENRTKKVQTDVADAYKTVDSYGDLVEEYAHYTYSGMTEAELALVDRVEVLDMLQRVVLQQAALGNWSLSGNKLSMQITGSSLEQINSIVQQLQAEPLVDYCTVSTAATNQLTSQTDDSVSENVTAQVTVYLVKEDTEGGNQ